MTPNETSMTPNPLDDDWIASLEECDDPQRRPLVARPAGDGDPAGSRRGGRLERSLKGPGDGEDWFQQLDKSRDEVKPATPARNAKSEEPRPAVARPVPVDRSDDDITHVFNDEPAVPLAAGGGWRVRTHAWMGRVVGVMGRACRKISRLQVVAASGLVAGLALGAVFRPVSPPPSPALKATEDQTRPRPAAPVSISPAGKSHEIVVAASEADGAFKTLEEAVRIAAPGQRIRVRPGTYAASLTLDKPVEIQGDGVPSEIILEAEGVSAMVVKSDGVQVRDLTVRVKAGRSDKPFGAIAIVAGQPLLEDLVVEAASDSGIAIVGETARPTIRRVTVGGEAEVGLRAIGGAGGSVEDSHFLCGQRAGALVDGANVVFVRSRFATAKRYGLAALNRGEATAIGCQFRNNGVAGAMALDGGILRLLGCETEGNGQAGVQAEDGAITIEGGRVARNTGPAIHGRKKSRLALLGGCILIENTQGELDVDGCQVVRDGDPTATQPHTGPPAPPPSSGAPAAQSAAQAGPAVVPAPQPGGLSVQGILPFKPSAFDADGTDPLRPPAPSSGSNTIPDFHRYDNRPGAGPTAPPRR